MVNRQLATEIAQGELRRMESEARPVLELVLSCEPLERSWGWVFFYNSRLALESGNPLDGLGGNAPVFVQRTDGSIWPGSGTAHPVEHYIDQLEGQLEYGSPPTLKITGLASSFDKVSFVLHLQSGMKTDRISALGLFKRVEAGESILVRGESVPKIRALESAIRGAGGVVCGAAKD
jgi:hypothetical protein